MLPRTWMLCCGVFLLGRLAPAGEPLARQIDAFVDRGAYQHGHWGMLLRSMATRPDFAQFERALPVLGQDGTLARTVAAESPVRGRVQAKTGTLFWSDHMNGGAVLTSKALAGYMTAASGRRLAFALFVNNLRTKNADDRDRCARNGTESVPLQSGTQPRCCNRDGRVISLAESLDYNCGTFGVRL